LHMEVKSALYDCLMLALW